ncbi:hydrolase [Paenibacillus baekrokdamisoli]|uniref:Hydrolase n=1 Tax=Paenibacillus baekrokdamisoli TaxID=1712516 RepID=A0A3G9JCJ2_9BACL|nr:alpha/beta hydrolase [Paenibacillus baekrokdamisoli]MBB3071231.1 pimeloyl-ACP methyl ester carboxylesterase [Paenibacillus baekrokdamisoli]BBH21648.1 hydrolase [Paenibacillus baekrokdamisoli]
MPFFHIGDVAIEYQQQGAGGIPIVFVHPPCITSALFSNLNTELDAAGPIIAFNIRGHGASESGPARLSLALIAEDMKHVLDQCDVEKAYLCGYGAASFPIIMALYTYPERFCGGILISGAASYTDISTRSKLQATFISSILKAKSSIVKQAVRMETENKAVVSTLFEQAMQGDPIKWKEYAEACLNASFDRELHHIKQPMLLLCGAEDQISRSLSEHMYGQLPNAEFFGVVGAQRQLLVKETTKTAFVMRMWLANQQQPERVDTFEERSEWLEDLVSHGVEEQMV